MLSIENRKGQRIQEDFSGILKTNLMFLKVSSGFARIPLKIISQNEGSSWKDTTPLGKKAPLIITFKESVVNSMGTVKAQI
jgi:hypothetical protein